MTDGARLGKHSWVAEHKAADEHPPKDDTELLIAALNNSWAWYDARVNRGLQVINYYLLASAVVATAYVSAINGKLYGIAAIIAVSEAALTTVAYMLGRRERWSAQAARPALRELQLRIADRLEMDAFRMARPPASAASRFAVKIAFGLAILLSIGSAIYALVH